MALAMLKDEAGEHEDARRLQEEVGDFFSAADVKVDTVVAGLAWGENGGWTSQT